MFVTPIIKAVLLPLQILELLESAKWYLKFRWLLSSFSSSNFYAVWVSNIFILHLCLQYLLFNQETDVQPSKILKFWKMKIVSSRLLLLPKVIYLCYNHNWKLFRARALWPGNFVYSMDQIFHHTRQSAAKSKDFIGTIQEGCYIFYKVFYKMRSC